MVKINYLLIKNGDKFTINSKEEFEKLYIDGLISSKTKLYDADNAELIVVEEVYELYQIIRKQNEEKKDQQTDELEKDQQNSELEKEQQTNELDEETLIQTPTNKQAISLAANNDLAILIEEEEIEYKSKNKGKNKTRHKRRKVFLTMFLLLIFALTVSTVFYLINARKESSKQIVREIILEMSNDLKKGEEIKGVVVQEINSMEYLSLIKDTQYLYNAMQQRLGEFKSQIPNEKIQEILNYSIYKNMDDAKDFDEDILNYIMEIESLVDDIEQSIRNYTLNLQNLKEENNYDGDFVESIKQNVFDTRDTMLDFFVKEIARMKTLNEILDFMIKNRDKYLVLDTGVRFLFDRDQDYYYSILSRFYSNF